MMEACFICYETSEYFAIGDCNHPLCMKCCIRLRVICGTNSCPICNVDLKQVIIADENTVQSSDYDLLSLGASDVGLKRKYGVKAVGVTALEATQSILANVCTFCEDRKEFATFDQLRDHVRVKHGRFYCDLCVKNLHLFSWERKIYTRDQLTVHEEEGDADDPAGYHHNHPLCQFCNARCYCEDQLYKHLREKHYLCRRCEEIGQNVFFDCTKELTQHLKKEHPFEREEEGKMEFQQPEKKGHKLADFLQKKDKDDNREISEGATCGRPIRKSVPPPRRASFEESDYTANTDKRFRIIDDDEEFPSISEQLTAAAAASTFSPKGRRKEEKARAISSNHVVAVAASSRPQIRITPKRQSNSPSAVEEASPQSDYDYAKPREFSERNRALFHVLFGSMRGDSERMKAFREHSLDFQRGRSDASSYCTWMRVLIDDDQAYANLFAELLCLLPDIQKQQLLLDAFLETGLRYCQGSIGKCRKCGQWLTKADYTVHEAIAHRRS